MKRNLLTLALIAALGVFLCSQTWAKDMGDPWEGDKFWDRYEAGEIQFAITVSEDEIATEDIPLDWTKEMIVDWLEAGWLVIEEVMAEEKMKIPAPKKQCHFIVRDYHRLCVTGAGAKRCDCYNDVHY